MQELPSTGDEDVTMVDAAEYQPSDDARDDQDMKVRLQDALSGCGRGEMPPLGKMGCRYQANTLHFSSALGVPRYT